MRSLEDIERDLAAAREALSSVEGTPAEVYSRIVGYYRSVRNWNKGKKEEYGERRLYLLRGDELAAPSPSLKAAAGAEQAAKAAAETRLLLFIRAACPACPPAKAAAGRLGIPVDLVNADTAEGLSRAANLNVLSTPTAILLSRSGEEIGRANNAEAIARLPVPAV